MTNSFILGLDLDAVVLQFNEKFARFVEKESGLKKNSLPPPNTWNFDNWPDFTREKFLHYYERFVMQGQLAKMKAYPGASDALWRLSDAGIYIRVITHRLILTGMHARAASDTITSLERNHIPYRDICFVATKTDVAASAYLDDAPHNIQAFQNAGKEVIIYSQAYNEYLEGERVTNWEEAEKKIFRLYEKWREENGRS